MIPRPISCTRWIACSSRRNLSTCRILLDQKPILTEYVYGRTRIYTSLPTMAKGKPATTGKTRVGSPVTSPPLSWQWLRPADSNETIAKSSHQIGGQENSNMNAAHYGFLGSIKQNLREMFLPVGYPESVHGCYKRFHFWLAIETYVGSAIGVLCSQAMLSSLGLGEVEAAGGAVAIQWVLKDGIGEFGKLFFIKRFASSFDSHPKTWKIVCEVFSAVGCFLQLCTSVVSPKFFLPLAAVGNMFNLVHESIWIASHMIFTKHFAINNNIGDIVAKDDAQMSTAHLLGMLTGVGVIAISHDPIFLFGAFSVLSPINFWSTIKMLRAAEFEVLNQAKVTLLGRSFIDTGKVEDHRELQPREIGFGECIRPYGPKGNISVRIKLGPSAEKSFASVADVQAAVNMLRDENYLLSYRKKTMWVLLHEDAESKDIIQAILHSLKFHDLLKQEQYKDAYMAALDDSLTWTKQNTDSFVKAMEDKGWLAETVYWNDGGIRISWEGYKSSVSQQQSS